MDLILWRHAEAEDGLPDEGRALTAKGERQAVAMAAWLSPRLPDGVRILVSPALRAQQTARALSKDLVTMPEIGVGAEVVSILAAAGWPGAGGAVLMVGHQPVFGQVAAQLMAGANAPWSLKKGAVWWFSHRLRDGRAETVLRLAMAPEFL